MHLIYVIYSTYSEKNIQREIINQSKLTVYKNAFFL